jgi:hypothetical protein
MCLHAKHVFSNQFGWYLSFNYVITEKCVFFIMTHLHNQTIIDGKNDAFFCFSFYSPDRSSNSRPYWTRREHTNFYITDAVNWRRSLCSVKIMYELTLHDLSTCVGRLVYLCGATCLPVWGDLSTCVGRLVYLCGATCLRSTQVDKSPHTGRQVAPHR